jgi:hypothetical protein
MEKKIEAGLVDELPVAPVTYTGHTVMFTNDDTGDNYADKSTEIVLDFAAGTGTFEANNFVPSEDNQGADREISVVGDLDLNTSAGALSSASEAIVTVNGQRSGGFINGLLTGDVTGAAGSIVVYDAAATDGVNVGVFAGKQ